MHSLLPVENRDITAALRRLLTGLLDAGIVEALYVPLRSRDGMVVPALVCDSARLETADPLVPVMPINSARAVSALTVEPQAMRLGAVLRPCEIRALVELSKLKQASLEGVALIGIDCLGTVELSEFRRLGSANGGPPHDLLPGVLSAARVGSEPVFEGVSPRAACQMCLSPVPERVDIHVHLFGVDGGQGLPVTLPDELAKELHLPSLDASQGWEPEKAKLTAEGFIARRKAKRSQELEAIRSQMQANGGFASLFNACIRCHNCMTVCPICYCKTCLFKTPAFDHEPAFYLAGARRKGAQRMLGDTVLFHLTRLNHMSTSCVSCGMCSSACPAEIPVGTIFSAVAEGVQSVFDYSPGRSPSEPLPLITFQADEWNSIGEE